MKDLKNGFYSVVALFFLLLQMCHNPSITQVDSKSSIDSILNVNAGDDCKQEVRDSLDALKAKIKALRVEYSQKPKDTTKLHNVKLY